MPKREPHEILGVARGASQATIKAAWRKLARQHHPDVAGSDAPAARAATRRMAEINRAYEQLQAGSRGRTAPRAPPRTWCRWPPWSGTCATCSATGAWYCERCGRRR